MKRITSVRPGRARRGLARGALLACVTCLTAAGMTASAQASISINSFSVSPSTTQAAAAPTIDLSASFGNPGGDTVNDATVSLAPGLLENPTVPAQCSTTLFSLDLCPITSWIGTGYVTASSSIFFGIPAPFGANLYLVTPSSGQIARIGLIINVLGIPLESTLAPISVRTATGDVGININLSGLPNNFDGLPLTLTGLNLKIFGSVDGQSFTRNPSSCATATSRITASSYGSPNQTLTGSSSFTPTGCSSLPYNPGASATATLDSGDAGVGYSATFTQGSGQASTRSISVTTPPALSPDLAQVAAGCTATDVTTCPSVGSATFATPYLSTPLTGKIALVSHPGGLPTPTIVFTTPISLVLPGVITLSSNPLSLNTTFANLPDLPFSKLTVIFNGGPTSLFLARAASLCTPPQLSSGTLIGANGASVSGSVPTTVIGCPSGSSSATATATPTATATATATTASAAVTPAVAKDGAVIAKPAKLNSKQAVRKTAKQHTKQIKRSKHGKPRVKR